MTTQWSIELWEDGSRVSLAEVVINKEFANKLATLNYNNPKLLKRLFFKVFIWLSGLMANS